MDKFLILEQMKLFKDKDLYYNASSVLKDDFDFVINVIKIFKDDFVFIENVAEEYCQRLVIKDIEDNPEYIELCILLGQYAPLGEEYDFYRRRLASIFEMFYLRVSYMKEAGEDISRLGFSLLFKDEYGKNVIDFFVVTVVEQILFSNSVGTFEDILHKSYDELVFYCEEDYEFFLISLFTIQDYYLGKYISTNRELLDKYVKELKNVEKNWFNYEKRLLDISVEKVKNWVSEKSLRLEYGNDFSYEKAFIEVIRSLKLTKQFGIEKYFNIEGKSNVISFSSGLFKRDLKNILEKIFLSDKLTITEIGNLSLEEVMNNKKLIK